MTAALCPRCAGNPHHREDGCVHCDDSGVEPAPRVHPYAIERAEWMVRRCLERYGYRYGAADVVRELAREPSDPRAAIRRLTGAPAPVALLVTLAYVAAIREHARVVRPRAARSRWTAAEAEAGRVADACEEHARRIESAPIRRGRER